MHGKGRFATRNFRVAPDSSLGTDCARFDAVAEERDNPLAKGTVLIHIYRDNYMCKHPHAQTPTLVWAGASERYLEGTPQYELLIGALKPQWEPSVRSLKFTL